VRRLDDFGNFNRASELRRDLVAHLANDTPLETCNARTCPDVPRCCSSGRRSLLEHGLDDLV